MSQEKKDIEELIAKLKKEYETNEKQLNEYKIAISKIIIPPEIKETEEEKRIKESIRSKKTREELEKELEEEHKRKAKIDADKAEISRYNILINDLVSKNISLSRDISTYEIMAKKTLEEDPTQLLEKKDDLGSTKEFAKKVWSEKEKLFEAPKYVGGIIGTIVGFIIAVVVIIAGVLGFFAVIGWGIVGIIISIIIVIFAVVIAAGWLLGGLIAGIKAGFQFYIFIDSEGIFPFIFKILTAMGMSWQFVFGWY